MQDVPANGAEHVYAQEYGAPQIALQMQALQQTIVNLQRQVNQQQERKSREDEQLPTIMEEFIPPHLQLPRALPEEDRKRILRNVPRYIGLETITDKNGLAAKGMPADKKKLVTKDLVNTQKDNLDIFRLATSSAVNLENAGPEGIQAAGEALIAIARLAYDNAQKATTLQLQHCMEHAKASGADYLINRSADNEKFSVEDYNIFQQAHLDGIKEFKRFATQMEKAKEPANKSNNPRNTQRGRGGRGNGGYNRYGGNRGYGGYSRGRGNGGRGGRGNYNNNQTQDQGK